MQPAASGRTPSTAGRLRLAHRTMFAELLGRIHAAGFPDVGGSQVAMFRLEGPDGRQPTEIATSAGLSKQATNDLLGQLERAGYLTRDPHPADGRARIVRLTARGRRLDAAIWDAGRQVEQAWKRRIGEPAWTAFQEVLDRIAQTERT